MTIFCSRSTNINTSLPVRPPHCSLFHHKLGQATFKYTAEAPQIFISNTFELVSAIPSNPHNPHNSYSLLSTKASLPTLTASTPTGTVWSYSIAIDNRIHDVYCQPSSLPRPTTYPTSSSSADQINGPFSWL